MNQLVELREQFERFREKFEALASMGNEDASQIDFGLGLPKERNQEMAILAAKYQAAVQPLEDLRLAIEAAINESVSTSAGK